MNRLIRAIVFGALLCMGMLAGCSSTTVSAVKPSPTSGALATIVSPTPVALSVALGTSLAGSGKAVNVVNPTSSFTSKDTFAFVIHLRGPINATKVACLIIDSQFNIAWQWYETTQPSDTVLASSTPELGSVLEKSANKGLPAGSSIPPPLGTYVLQVFPYPSSPLNYANNVTFIYIG